MRKMNAEIGKQTNRKRQKETKQKRSTHTDKVMQMYNYKQEMFETD